ncbi:hypothetical protein EBX31_01650 [bacterium]|nr:hypothetical protein [bacterium]
MHRLGRFLSINRQLLVRLFFTIISQYILAYLTLYIQEIYPVWSSPFWPASGAALAACLLGGPWMLLGVYIGLVMPNITLWSANPGWTSFILPLGNVAETGCALLLLRMMRKPRDIRFNQVGDTGWFLTLAPWVPAMISALFVQTVLMYSGITPKDRYAGELLIFWLGNATGIMLITPIVLVWRDIFKFQWNSPKGQSIIFLLLSITFALFIFHAENLPKYIRMLSVLAVPIAVWGVWTTGFRGATLLSLLTSFTYFIFDVPSSQPISTLLNQRHLQANISFISAIRVESPINRMLPQPSLIEEALEQIGILTALSLTILPLGAASDELRRRGEHDDLVMKALDATFWTWTQRDGLHIYNPKIANLIATGTLLFQADQSSGQLLVPARNKADVAFLSHWAVTERDTRGDPLVVDGILQNQSEATQRKAAEERALLANLEIQALRSHLNPHLIFNCLTGLRAMIKTKPELAREFTGRLARFLRAVVDSQASTLITLSHEIEICLDYIGLEKDRGRYVELVFKPDSILSGVFLPPLSIVTLLENAVKHGLPDSQGKITIEFICQKQSGGRIQLTVRNKGEIRPLTNTTPRGLSLLAQQLRRIHHPRSTVALIQKPSQWVEAIVSLECVGANE